MGVGVVYKATVQLFFDEVLVNF